MENNKEIWRQMDGEPDDKYNLFVLYADISYKRSVRKVAEMSKFHHCTIYRTAKKWNWKKRAAQYDKSKYNQISTSVKEAIVSSNAQNLNTKLILADTVRETLENLRKYLSFYPNVYRMEEVKLKLDYIKNIFKTIREFAEFPLITPTDEIRELVKKFGNISDYVSYYISDPNFKNLMNDNTLPVDECPPDVPTLTSRDLMPDLTPAYTELGRDRYPAICYEDEEDYED